MSLRDAFARQSESVTCPLCSAPVARGKIKECRRKRNGKEILVDLAADDNRAEPEASGSNVEGQVQSQVSVDDGADNSTDKFHPYYSRIFIDIVKDISERDSLQHLFDSEDKVLMQAFLNASGAPQKLFVRLFLRKDDWLSPSRLVYPQISNDIPSVLQYLHKLDFLHNLTSEKADLVVVLNLLAAKDLKTLTKTYKVDAGNKKCMVQSLVNMAINQKGVFGSIKFSMLKKALALLGSMYRMCDNVRCLFERVLILYAPTDMQAKLLANQPSLNLAQQLLFTMMQSETATIKFPDFDVQMKFAVLFSDRAELMQYKGAMQLQTYVVRHANCSDHEMLKEICERGQLAQEKLMHLDYSEFLSKRCDWWLPYTAAWVYTSIVWHTVEAMQKLRLYEQANEMLKFLLRHDESAMRLCTKYRGKWWERLALNLDSHMKQKDEALRVIADALNDDHVKDNSRYNLISRKSRICKDKGSRKRKFSENEADLDMTALRDLPTITINGQVLKKNLGFSTKQNHFISESSTNNNVALCNVESIAISHYLNQGYEKGVHGEGCPWKSLLCLLCWDQIYDTAVEKVWVSRVQTDPLDSGHPLFYSNRKQALDARILWIHNCSNEELRATLESSWNDNFGKSSFLMCWDNYEDVSTLQDIAVCCGGARLSQVLSHLLVDLRHRQSGFPDLVMYDTLTGTLKVVEVKGPGDRLSSKQRIWLNFFLSIDVPAEVCLVQAKTHAA